MLKIHWLGFDKFKNLLYGFRNRPDHQEYGCEIFMLSIFSKTPKFLKRITFFYREKPIHLTSALSSCGNFIVFGYYPKTFYNDEQYPDIYFYKFSIEKDELVNYRLLKFDTKNITLQGPPEYQLKIYHTSEIGWVGVAQYYNDEACRTFILVKRIIFNDTDKTCSFEHIFEKGEFKGINNWPILRGWHVMFFASGLQLVSTFALRTKCWITKKFLIDNEELKHLWYFRVCSSENEQNLIAVPSLICAQKLIFYKLDEENWAKMHISAQVINMHDWEQDCYFVEYDCLCSSNLLFLTYRIDGSNQASEDAIHSDVFALFANTNVLSLKNLAMKRIFNSYSELSAQKMMEITDMPYILKRQYFGPKWAW